MDTPERAQRVWSQGSYDEQAPDYFSMAGELVEHAGVEAEDEVLDVGCGTGTVAITAARRGATVTGVDVAPPMLERARENAAIAGVEDVEWREGAATDLPVEDDAVDVTLSNLGHMYGDPPGAAARELLRVTRPGGRIGFTAWTPTALYPFMAGVVTTYLDPADHPEFTEPPFMWGDSDVVERRLGGGVDDLAFATATTTVPALSPAHWYRRTVDTAGVFAEFVAAVDEDDRPALREELIEAIEGYFDDRRNAVELEYLRTTATVQG